MNVYRVCLHRAGREIALRVKATSTAQARTEAVKIAPGFQPFSIVLLP